MTPLNVLPRAVSVSGEEGLPLNRLTELTGHFSGWGGGDSDWFGDTNGSVPGFSLEGDYKRENKIIIKGIQPIFEPNWLNKS